MSRGDKRAAAASALRLIGEGANVDFTEAETGITPLIWASMCEELDAVPARLVAAGAKLDLVDKNGFSALMFACINKRAATAMLLVEAGTALNLATPCDGLAALDWADISGLASVAAAIRARGGVTSA